MTLVVDASVAVKWLVEEEESERAFALLRRERLVAPELVVAEVGNVLWRHFQVGRLGREQCLEGGAALLECLDEIYPLSALARRATEVAMELSHPLYDCFYLVLAEELKTEVVTADRRLAEKVRGTAFEALLRRL